MRHKSSLQSVLQSTTSKSRNGGRQGKRYIHPKSRCLEQLVRKARHKEKVQRIRANRQKALSGSPTESALPTDDEILAASEEENYVDFDALAVEQPDETTETPVVSELPPDDT
eukprot:CAMPEP_0201512528 /NCGR_PEP_ID=MMETSP0161_2-20130828/4767_1 /ASSEMBLY_ACC=CAM_ASM_000251 /TAXON_ID=180227 /ORGANISM="Neoparamoeba aestuarina, Strain SoJaBio B1-5/56/2" /LENGTH=112 /DNA_ID=CAMNT_0047908407 /DNA_START=33 /DNA_END=367 /DNA_ORIENTATION=-